MLPLLLRLGAADELNRLNRRVANERKARDRAESGLSGIVVQPRVAATPQEDVPALVAVLRVIVREMRWKLTLPGETGKNGMPTLEAILRSSGLRKRELTLDSGWWHDDICPVLLQEGPDGQPAALLRQGRRVRLVAADGTERRLRRVEAALLRGPACMLYESLPEWPVASSNLVRRAWQLGRHEILGSVGVSAAVGLLSLLSPILTGIIAKDLIPSRLFEVVIDGGRVMESETYAELMAAGGPLARIAERQLA